MVLSISVSAVEYHVAKTGSDSNKGDADSPLLTIQAAAGQAWPGDIIIVHEGVYRERVNPPRGGASDNKRIVYRAAKGETVVIKGSERIKDWKKIGEYVWKVTIPNSFFGGFNPYNDVIGGEWYKTPKDGFDRHTGAVYLNGHWLTETPNIDSVLQPVCGKLCWFCEVDGENTILWAQFGDVDPNEEMVEINVRQCVFYPDQPGRNYITVRGFIMRHAATPWSGAMSEQIGMIGTHWSKGWIIEDNVISHSMNTGVTLGRYELKDIPLPPTTAPGFVKSIELALEDGWSREKIGSHIIRNNHISNCEKNGIHGSLGGIFSTIEGNTICDIGMQDWISGPDVAGLKLLGAVDVLIRNNHFYRCAEVGALWLDWMAQGTRVTGNLFHDNRRDLFVEVNHGPFLVDNNIFLSEAGLLESSGGGAYAHNLFACQIILRTELDREVPFHETHSTKVLGLSKIIGDDERFYNNLFVGYGGLSVYDAWEVVHLKAGGNVYLAGARPVTGEQGTLVLKNPGPAIRLMEKADGWWLEMSMDPEPFTEIERNMVTSTLLGKSIVPGMPFVQPDGTPYRLDIDFFGEERDADNPSPGPFENLIPGTNRLKIWQKHRL
jgi:alpha-N-arabinofuranosidase